VHLRADQRLLISYLVLIAVVVTTLSAGAHFVLLKHLTRAVDQDLRRELALGSALYRRSPSLPQDSAANLLGSLSGRRVTLVGPDGTVLGDSEVPPEQLSMLENHATRPEIVQARSRGIGRDVRLSSSLGTEHLYLATPAPGGVTIRFAVPLVEVHEAVRRVQRGIMVVGLLGVALAGLFSLGFSISVTRPLRGMRDVARAMAAGDLSRRLPRGRADELGELAVALNTLADQLQRRLAQLEDERAETQALIDSMAEGVLALGPDGTVRRANPAAQRIFSFKKLTGVTPQAVARRPEFLRLVERVLNGHTVPPTELTYDGRHLLATGHPLPTGGAALVFLDVSELRRLESVRRDFVANASHELKTPLTAIRGYSETLLDHELAPELRQRFTEVVRSNADRLQHIVDDLLDLSRIESGGWRVEPQTLDVEEAARDAWSSCLRAAEQKQISFAIRLDPTCRVVRADPAALRQIFSNLFSNALRHTPPGGRVEVSARCLESETDATRVTSLSEAQTEGAPGASGDGRWVAIEVRDTGSGIPAVHLPRIFERFYRADPARSRAEGGTGLGLAIVRHLVEGHGGQVDAESQIGRGTTVRFTLPAADGRPSAPRSAL
jgi:two-component system phosphate regulon sensor histidine kinase PhoR